MLLSIYLASAQTSWWGFVAFYVSGYSVGVGVCYYTVIATAYEWFPNNKGLMSGLIVGSYGLGASLFGFLSTAVVNPNHI